MKVVAFVAHPDDELLGVGGTLLRHVAAGDEVHVHIECTQGLRDRNRRLMQTLRVVDRAGWTCTFGDSDELADHVAPFETDADIIYTHHPGDLNQAHRAVAEAALVAGRFARTVRTFETVSSTEWGLTPFLPDFYVGIAFHEKMALLDAYESEMREFPHPRSLANVQALARLRGSTVGLFSAEAFHTIRDTWR